MDIPLQPITVRFYGNWTVNGPDGSFMFKCDEKKANWYLNRKLADDHGNNVIQLNFVPKGNGKLNACPYFHEKRENVCVVCGNLNNLTRHHVVPKAFRSLMPVLSTNDAFDVLMVCIDCHDDVEDTYDAKKRELIKSIGWKPAKMSKEMRDKNQLHSLINAYQKYKDEIPMHRKAEILHKLHDLSGGAIAGFADIVSATVDKSFAFPEDDYPYPKIIAEIKDHKAFIVMWRKLFLKAAKPKFLSQAWIDCHETYFKIDCP